MTLRARLGTKDSTQVHCGACGKAFAYIWSPIGIDPPGTRMVALPEGWWRYDDGVWALSETARRKLRRGFPMSSSARPPCDVGLIETLYKQVRVTQPYERRLGPRRYGFALTELPVDARCSYPGCGMRQTLDPSNLNAVPARSEE